MDCPLTLSVDLQMLSCDLDLKLRMFCYSASQPSNAPALLYSSSCCGEPQP